MILGVLGMVRALGALGVARVLGPKEWEGINGISSGVGVFQNLGPSWGVWVPIHGVLVEEYRHKKGNVVSWRANEELTNGEK